MNPAEQFSSKLELSIDADLIHKFQLQVNIVPYEDFRPPARLSLQKMDELLSMLPARDVKVFQFIVIHRSYLPQNW